MFVSGIAELFVSIFENRDIDDFFYLASILRLSTKYFISNLRLQAIKALLRTWSNTLQGHDAMVERALQAPTNSDPDSLTYPYVHPIHVLNLARETNVQIIIPSALYFLSIYPIKDIISGTHPKLTVKSRLGLPRPSSILSHEDMKNYSIMYQHRIDLILDYSRNVLGKRRASSSCVFANAKSNSEDLDGYASRCTQAFARLASLVSRSWYTRTGPLKWMLQSIEMIDKNELPLCHICRYHFTNDVQAHRKWIWKTLPGIIDLPSWEEMEKMDLSEDLSNSTLD